MPELPKPDKTLLREILGSVVKKDFFQEKAEQLRMRQFVQLQKSPMIAFPDCS
jgi:hypothetical protein